MMRGRSDGGQKKRLIASVCVVALFVCFFYMYYDSSSQGASALEYGRSLRKLGSSYLGGDDDNGDAKQDDSVSNGENSLVVAKSFPVSSFFFNRNLKFGGIFKILLCSYKLTIGIYV